ncbi:MAG TPA: hypothetical protein VNV63_06195 [Nitrospiria bacterium]|jgi:hypothetical protein|nr:hypothetical protein [Nitrospiria bacterium]
MTFTDDDQVPKERHIQVFSDLDLKRYKNHDYSLPSQASWNDAIDALLARLEAAELALTDVVVCPCEKGHFHLLKGDHYEAWRKASGK